MEENYSNADYNYLDINLTSIGTNKLNTISKNEEKTVNNIYFHGLCRGKVTSLQHKNPTDLVIRWKKLYKDKAGKESADLLYKLHDDKLFKKCFIDNEEKLRFNGVSMGNSSMRHCLKKLFKKAKKEIETFTDEDFNKIWLKQKLTENEINTLDTQDKKQEQALKFFKSKINIELAIIPGYFFGIGLNVDKFTNFLKDSGMNDYLENISIFPPSFTNEPINDKFNFYIHPFERTIKFLKNILKDKDIQKNDIIFKQPTLEELIKMNTLFIPIYNSFNNEEFLSIFNSKKSPTCSYLNLDFIFNYDTKVEKILENIYLYMNNNGNNTNELNILFDNMKISLSNEYLANKIKLNYFLEKKYHLSQSEILAFLNIYINKSNINEVLEHIEKNISIFEIDAVLGHFLNNLKNYENNKAILRDVIKNKFKKSYDHINNKRYNLCYEKLDELLIELTTECPSYDSKCELLLNFIINDNKEVIFEERLKLLIDYIINLLPSDYNFDTSKFEFYLSNPLYSIYLNIQSKLTLEECNSFLDSLVESLYSNDKKESIISINDKLLEINLYLNSKKDSNISFKELINSEELKKFFPKYQDESSQLNNNIKNVIKIKTNNINNQVANIEVNNNIDSIVNNNKEKKIEEVNNFYSTDTVDSQNINSDMSNNSNEIIQLEDKNKKNMFKPSNNYNEVESPKPKTKIILSELKNNISLQNKMNNMQKSNNKINNSLNVKNNKNNIKPNIIENTINININKKEIIPTLTHNNNQIKLTKISESLNNLKNFSNEKIKNYNEKRFKVYKEETKKEINNYKNSLNELKKSNSTRNTKKNIINNTRNFTNYSIKIKNNICNFKI